MFFDLLDCKLQGIDGFCRTHFFHCLYIAHFGKAIERHEIALSDDNITHLHIFGRPEDLIAVNLSVDDVFNYERTSVGVDVGRHTDDRRIFLHCLRSISIGVGRKACVNFLCFGNGQKIGIILFNIGDHLIG